MITQCKNTNRQNIQNRSKKQTGNHSSVLPYNNNTNDIRQMTPQI